MPKKVKITRIITLGASLYVIIDSIIVSQKYNIRLYNSPKIPILLIAYFLLTVFITALSDLLITKKYYKQENVKKTGFISSYTQTVFLFGLSYMFFVITTFQNILEYEEGIELKFYYHQNYAIFLFITMLIAFIMIFLSIVKVIILKYNKTKQPIFFDIINIIISIIYITLCLFFFIFMMIESFQFK